MLARVALMRQGPYRTVLGWLCFGNKEWKGNVRAKGLEMKIPIEEGVPGLVGSKGVSVVANGSHQFESCQVK